MAAYVAQHPMSGALLDSRAYKALSLPWRTVDDNETVTSMDEIRILSKYKNTLSVGLYRE